jgi:outer membrane usher protein
MGTPSLISMVEISTEPDPRAARLVLKLQGAGHQGQVVQLQQKGLVFFEQRLADGPFTIDQLRPFDPNAEVTLLLKSTNLADEKISLPLKPQEKRTLYAKHHSLTAPTPMQAPKDSAGKAGEDDEDVEFDSDFLRGNAFRNVDSAAMKKLGRARPGNVDVEVFRNGEAVTKSTVKFTEPPGGGEARACIDAALFMQLGIKPEHVSPAGAALVGQGNPQAQSAGCMYIDQWVEGASAKYDVSQLRLDLSVPQAFLTRLSRRSVPPGMLTRGENAGFVNYNLNHYETQGQTSDFLGLNSGINVQGWQVRHTSYLSQSNSASAGNSQQYVAGETFVRRPLIDWKSTLALGEIASSSPILGSLPLRGLRLASEEGLMSDEERSYRPVVRGVARTNARVRVSQNGAVFFELTVPPGPFELNDLNPPSSVGNLTLSITEADGSTQSFLVPYSLSAGKLNPGSVRYSLSAGNYRSGGVTTEAPLLQAYLRYGLNTLITPGLEWMVSPDYASAGLQLAFNNPWGYLALNRAQTQGSGRSDLYAVGQNQSITYNTPVMGPLTLYSGVSQQSLGYVSPLSALSSTSLDPYSPLNPKNSVFVSLGLSLGKFGGLSLSAVEQTTWTEGRVTNQYRLSYSTLVSQLSLSVYMAQTHYTDGTPSADSVGFSAALPLGGVGSGGGVRYNQNQTGTQVPLQTLSAYGSAFNNQVNYNLNQSQTGDVGSTSASASVQYAYGSLGASVSGNNQGGSLQSGVSASGGLVVHSDGVIMSPTVGSTFAIVELPQGEGAGFTGSQARINSSGFGVLPNLSAYLINDVQISLEGASADLEVEAASQRVAPVEGSIVRLRFSGTRGRPLLLLLITDKDGRIPIGGTVTDSAGNEVGTVGQGSRALVRVQKPTDTLRVQWGDKPDEVCSATYLLDDKNLANASGFTPMKLRCVLGPETNKAAPVQASGNTTVKP